MTKAQYRNLQACREHNCPYLHRCKVHWGKRCNRQGGRKVPRLRLAQQYSYTYS